MANLYCVWSAWRNSVMLKTLDEAYQYAKGLSKVTEMDAYITEHPPNTYLQPGYGMPDNFGTEIMRVKFPPKE